MNAFLRAAEMRALAMREERLNEEARRPTIQDISKARDRIRVEVALLVPELRKKHPGVRTSRLAAMARAEVRKEWMVDEKEITAQRQRESEEIAKLLAQGLGWKEAADRLGIEMREFEARRVWAKRAGLL